MTSAARVERASAPGQAAPPAVRTEGLGKRYGADWALHELAIEVLPGEIYGFLGPNGAGKSTTIRLMLDLIRPTTGRATVMGRDCRRDGVRARALLGYLPGELGLYGSWRGQEIADLIARMRGGVPAERIAELAERLSLDLSRRVRDLSKGNRQKLGVVLALMHRPPVLLLDEPTSGLDPIRQHVVWDLLREEAARGTAVLLSSHVLSEVELVCDRVAVLREGRLVRVAAVEDLIGRAGGTLEITVAGDAPDDLDAVPGVRVLARHGSHVRLRYSGQPDALLKRLARERVTLMRCERLSLDEVIMDMYEESGA